MLVYSIGEVARLAGVSQRLLGHYDEIRLLVPSDRTVAGPRQYSQTDLLRLQRLISYLLAVAENVDDGVIEFDDVAGAVGGARCLAWSAW